MVGITGIMGSIAGAGSDEELFGTKPIVPDYPELDAAQREAIAANKKALPKIKEVASEVNRFNQDELLAMLEETLPGGVEQIQANINSELRGEIPKSVQDFIRRNVAERAVAGGFGGSNFAKNLEARDFGITSYQMTQHGLDSAQRWMQQAKAPMYDPTSMFLSPAQQFAAREGKYQRDLYANTLAAAPDPAKRGAWDSEMAMIGMVLSVYGGGAGYTGGYRQEEKKDVRYDDKWWEDRSSDDRYIPAPTYSGSSYGGWQSAPIGGSPTAGNTAFV